MFVRRYDQSNATQLSSVQEDKRAESKRGKKMTTETQGSEKFWFVGMQPSATALDADVIDGSIDNRFTTVDHKSIADIVTALNSKRTYITCFSFV